VNMVRVGIASAPEIVRAVRGFLYPVFRLACPHGVP